MNTNETQRVKYININVEARTRIAKALLALGTVVIGLLAIVYVV